MSNVPLMPTHVVLTTDEITAAWNGQLVAQIEEADGVSTIVFLFAPDYAATTFTSGLKHKFPPDWGVDADQVLSVYGNGNHEHPIPWLPDDALVTKVHTSGLSLAIRADKMFRPSLPLKTVMEIDENFCACLTAEWDGVPYRYGSETCPIHGPHDPNELISGLTHAGLSLTAATSIIYTERIEPYAELQFYTIYGKGTWLDDATEGLFVSTPDNKFGHEFYFMPRSVFAREHWQVVTDGLPVITIK